MSPLTQTRCELGFEYDRSQFSSSIITEWNLVCDREWMANFSQMVLMIGVLIGNSDYLRHKRTILVVLKEE